MNKWQRLVLFAAAPLILAACGGGGGGGGSPCLAVGGCGGSSSSSTSSGGSSSSTTTTYAVTVAATDANGASTNTLKFGSALDITAKLVDNKGNPVVGAKIAYTVSDTSKASVTKGGSVLSDGVGVGLVQLAANNTSSEGVVTVTVTATVSTGTAGTATAAVDLQINASSVPSVIGAPSYLKYVSATPTRLFIKGASAGNVNAVETTQVKFEVRDKDDAIVPDASIQFDVTKRNVVNGKVGILTGAPSAGVAMSSSPVLIKADKNGIATVTIQSGEEPISFNVIATIPGQSTTYLSNDRIVVSSNKPNQAYFFMLWEAGSSCLNTGTRSYPCTAVVYIGDEKGQPVADGTVVNFVSSTGIVLADSLGQNPSGACLTKDSQCTVKYTGNAASRIGYNLITAYTEGQNAPVGQPVTKDGSWVDNGMFGTQSNVVVSTTGGSADGMLRNCLPDKWMQDSLGNPLTTPSTCVPDPTPDYTNNP
jgi:hypothetical protein